MSQWCYFHGQEHDESLVNSSFRNTDSGVYAGKHRICDTLPGVPPGSKLRTCTPGYQKAYNNMKLGKPIETSLKAPPPDGLVPHPPTPLESALEDSDCSDDDKPLFSGNPLPPPPPPPLPPLPNLDQHISSTAALEILRRDLLCVEALRQENTQLRFKNSQLTTENAHLGAENTRLSAELVEANASSAAANRLRYSMAQALGMIDPEEEESDMQS